MLLVGFFVLVGLGVFAHLCTSFYWEVLLPGKSEERYAGVLSQRPDQIYRAYTEYRRWFDRQFYKSILGEVVSLVLLGAAIAIYLGRGG